MANKKVQKKQPISERPLDPTRNAEDLFGDTTGMTGITKGSAIQTSAEPTDQKQDTSDFLGGVLQDPTHPNPSGIPRSEEDTKTYKKKVLQDMSKTRAGLDTERATEKEQPNRKHGHTVDTRVDEDTYEQDMREQRKEDMLTSSALSDEGNNRQQSHAHPPSTRGEQSVSGDMPDPEAVQEEDLLEEAHDVGEQLDEDLEHPEELDLGRDLDEAEEYQHTH